MSHQDRGHGPLIAFTTLAIAGCGTLVTAASPFYPRAAADRALWYGVGCVLASLALSSRHLGRRDRAHRAALGFTHSPISREGALGVLVAAAGLVAATGLDTRFAGPDAADVVRGAIVAFGVLFLVSIGLVYRLRGQLTWTGFAALTPLTGGLAFGAILLNSAPPPTAVSTVTLAAIGLDAAVFSQRWRRVVQVAIDHAGALPDAFERRHEWLAARFLLLNALPTFSLFVWPTPLAAAIALAGVFIDRMAFYNLGLQLRTEVEIARVERVIGS